MVQFQEEKQQRKLDEFRKKEEEDLAAIIAERHSLPYLNLNPIPINTDALRLIDEPSARNGKIAAFNVVGRKVHVGLLNPDRQEAKEVLENLGRNNLEPIVYVVSEESLKKAWEKYSELSFASETKAGALEISSEDIKSLSEELKNINDVKAKLNDIVSGKKSLRISHALEVILGGALAIDASDVHIEPEEKNVRLRYRLDGVLSDITFFDHDTYNLILSRIKLLSGLKLNIKEDAQDGRFSVKLSDTDIEIRTSILPGAYAEAIVMRVLNPKTIAVPFEDLGIANDLFKRLDHEIKKPNGMILTTGPTGSGKTTTLYAFLKRLHSPEIKIITIEDPIEYHLPGIVQTQVEPKKGYTFLQGLRSALRQDPDVIMVGEIRDRETAEIAINAALTGHLVFSTLHTNNAAGSFTRLIDLGVNPRVITSAINISMAQRLVRKLCDKCKKNHVLSEAESKLIDSTTDSIADKSILPKKPWTAFEPVGCEACNFTGYRGRTGIYEAIASDSAIEKVVNGSPSERSISEAAKPQNILNMKQDGVIKVITGNTSLDELARVIDIDTDD